MSTITLSNQNANSAYRKAEINIETGKCVLDKKEEIDKAKLISIGFQHPLIKEPILANSHRLFHYEYSDINGLLYSATYVYSILLQTADSMSCKFKISPLPDFLCPTATETIYFSINSHQMATEIISLKQLEAIVTDMSGSPFKFLEGMIIDQEFTLVELPQTVKGDLLYKKSEKLLKLLKTPCDLNRYEIRYINPQMGLGLFSRDIINEDEWLFFYAGEKLIKDTDNAKYAFSHRLDCLNMYLDACHFGNLSRFVNHAPDPTKILPNDPLLEANLRTTSEYVNGIEIVLFSANRTIAPGEQLLVDYGKKFFTSAPMYRFKPNGKMSTLLKANSQKKINQMRIMADHGVNKAQRYLLNRMLVIVVVIVMLIGAFEAFF